MILEILQVVNVLLAGSLVLFLNIPVILSFITFLKNKDQIPKSPNGQAFLSCIITSYEDPALCHLLIDSLLKCRYDQYEILVVLDHTDSDFVFEHTKVKLIKPPEDLHSKLRSIDLALKYINEKSESIIILDPDNLAHPDFLLEINRFLTKPFAAVQARRKAKNTNSPLAYADALGEVYYHYTDRKLPFEVGSSASISGSGFYIDKACLEEFLHIIELKPITPHLGEDKLLQNYLIGQGYRIAYNDKAIIFDEKVSRPSQLRRQRARWIVTYFNNIKDAFLLIQKGILKRNWNMLVFGFVTLRPPMFLNVGLILLLVLINLIGSFTALIILMSGVMIFSLFFLYTIKQLGVLKYLKYLPGFIYNQFFALFQARRFRHHFGKTPVNSMMSIEEALKRDKLP
jgi:cellulose synthase/poly-beta-1,6-N-acetylglucosamine synthase-like glycosyltransferase